MMKRLSLLVVTLASASATTKKNDNHNNANMNGLYAIANSAAYSTAYTAEYFDAYSPIIRTRYGEVFWKRMDSTPLPAAIQERFAQGRVMAIVGYEVDQVRQDAVTGEEVSVPITWAYNHHYIASITNSQKVTLVQKEIDATQPPHAGMFHHGGSTYWTDVPLEDNEDGNGKDDDDVFIPYAHVFSEGNGGEFRKSYHGYPAGYAQLIESPDTFTIAPMQIDTWNRETDGAAYVPGGPLPANSGIPASAGYSGLIECPCTDRLPIEWHMTYGIGGDSDNDKTDDHGGTCSGPVGNAKACFQGAKTVFAANVYRTETILDTQQPRGCFVVPHADASVSLVWNDANGRHDDGLPLAQAQRMEETTTVADAEVASFVATAHSYVNLTVELLLTDDEDGRQEYGNNKYNKVKLTMTGPADRWFGVGFGTHDMCEVPMQADECPGDGPYVIIVSAEKVVERKLDFHGPGVVLGNDSASSLTVLSNELMENHDGDLVRRVIVERPLQGATPKHYSFQDPRKNGGDGESNNSEDGRSLPIITAVGCDLHFGQHCGHGPAQLFFLQVDKPTTVCETGVAGTIGGATFNDKHRCAPFPTSDLAREGHDANPTCSVQTYRGGLSCCRHEHFLLDKDQEIPWPDQYLEYQLKFRIYFEDYKPAESSSFNSNGANEVPPTPRPSHLNLVRLYWTTEAFAGEYDIIQCAKSTPRSQCVHMITSRWKVRDMLGNCSGAWCTGPDSTDPKFTKGIELIYAGPHCHAPSCLSMELYNSDTGELLCHVEPIFGSNSNEKYGEDGFVAIPPCLWGDKSEGLAPPVLLSLNTTLLSIKRNNSTLGHTGEMASWQMRGVVVPQTTVVTTKVDGADDATKESSLRGRAMKK